MILKTKNKPQIYLRVSLSTSKKIMIAGGAFALLSVLIMIFYFNTGIHKTVKAENSNEFLKSTLLSKNKGKNNISIICKKSLIFKNKLTITAWIKWDSIPQSSNKNATIVSKYSENFNQFGQFWLQHNSSSQNFEFKVSTSEKTITTNSITKPIKNKWYNITGVYDGSTISIYINGKIEDQKILTGNLTDYCTFGYYAFEEEEEPNLNSPRYKGKSDDISIWNIDLNEMQIRKFLSTNFKKTDTNPPLAKLLK